MSNDSFELVGIIENKQHTIASVRTKQKWPIISAIVLGIIVFSCIFAELFMTKDPVYMDLANCSVAPNKEFILGTDVLGRDIFSMILYGGRISLFVGILATVISTVIAIVFGAVSGLSSEWIDSLLMRFTEIVLSIPSLLLIILLQAIMGEASIISISIVIGVTSWTSIAKVVRTEVRQIRNSEYVIASRTMGGGFFHILIHHLTPNFISSIMFMVVMNIRSAIVAESTLSFMGIGLPIEIISWGSMLSNAQRAMLTKSWWIIVVPGVVLVLTLLCITNIGNYIRANANKKDSKL